MGKRKVRIGQVVSDKMDKTVVVTVETSRTHPLYKKSIRKVKRYKVHDENNVCQIGDKVKIMETRPLSKEKKWRVAEIMSRGLAGVSPEAANVQLSSPIGGEEGSVSPPHPLSDEGQESEPLVLRKDDSELQQT